RRRAHPSASPPPAPPAAYGAYLRRVRRPTHFGFLVCRRDSDALVGVVNVSEIVRGAFCSAYLGYYAFVPWQRQGLMTKGLSLVIDHAFRRLRLHRLEANIPPRNPASIRLLRRPRVWRAGHSPPYLA